MAADLRTSSLTTPVDCAEYLFRRLHEVGVRAVHGVPGDYNLVALDYIPRNGLSWVGNCNELNAGYAADGYARVKGISAIVTTFGVGELSAINAIAGAYSEYVPVVHIVGTPSTLSQRDGMLLHHTLGNGDFNVFANMNKDISCAISRLDDPGTAPMLIDHAIRQCYLQSRPVYITLPTDMVQKKVEGARLEKPIDLEFPTNDKEKEDYVVDVVLKYLHEAKNPVILVDACATRHRVLEEVNDLVKKSKIPTFVAPMGKGAVNESLPNYGGVYAGDGSNKGVRERVDSSDLILTIGAIKSDFNTAGFSYRISQLSTIDFHSNHITVRFSEYPGVHMKGVLRRLIDEMDLGKLTFSLGPTADNTIEKSERDMSNDQIITQAWFWPRMGQWLRPRDIVITETGTANFGIWETRFPEGVTAISQVLWGSIGYSVGATQGAALAAKKDGGDRRTILFVGDGSFQLGCQELSTMIRQGLTPIIFIICNDGYTIERYIHGMDASYNDIQPWKHAGLLDVFGAGSKDLKSVQVRTKQELHDLFDDAEFSAAKHLQLVELFVPKEDAPRALKLTAESSARTNAKNDVEKPSKQWRTPKQQGHRDIGSASFGGGTIEPGDSGVWATCDKGREGKCVVELRDFLEKAAEEIYGNELREDEEDGDGAGDIESSIQQEIQQMRAQKSSSLFTAVKLNIPCVLFFKTRPPIDPETFVHELCTRAASGKCKQRTRFVKRLTPATLIGKAYEASLVEVAKTVLAPHFHQPDRPPKKFAIRPTLRSHTAQLSRDVMIKRIAEVVGPGHAVDLKKPDLLILAEVYKNICSVCVVPGDFEELKRYNLAEIYEPTPRPVEENTAASKGSGGGGGAGSGGGDAVPGAAAAAEDAETRAEVEAKQDVQGQEP
ncbi:MAG: Pyruvate decarboxylase 1 [Thelocarpon impressellum]|nr:MAG: Pyruvate decarboxylase 1 [Thelocarpon impressellum]